MRRFQKNKFKNKRVEYDGIMFDSKKERDYYVKLKLRQRAGEIFSFECQPVFKFPMPRCAYRADFRVIYWDEGKQIEEIIDVKSAFTKDNPVYKLKIKMLKYFYPEVNFKEVVL